MLECCHGGVIATGSAWVQMAVVSICMAGSFAWVVLMLRPGGAPTKFQRELSVAIVSAFLYVAMALPFYRPSWWGELVGNVQENYIWLPFWFAFVLAKNLGSFYEVALYSVLGTGVGVLAMVFLNYLTPGGAGSLEWTESERAGAWVPGGYHPVWAWLYSAVFVYGVFLSRWNVSMKQYALGFYSSIIVSFMSTHKDASNMYESILWNYHFVWNWEGPVLGSVYVTLAAVPLSALSLPVLVCSRRWRRFYSCRAQAARGLSKVAADTMGTLERLITYFREDSTNFDVESSFLYVRQLGQRRANLECLLKQARWECWNQTTKQRLKGLSEVSALLQCLRQVLRAQLEQLRGRSSDPSAAEVAPHLEEFVSACNEAMGCFISYTMLHAGLSPETRAVIGSAAARADAALVEALRKIPQGRSSHFHEHVFIASLRSFPDLLLRYSRREAVELWRHGEVNAKDQEECEPRSWLPHQPCLLREQHLNAARNTLSWLLALAWSRRVERPTCALTVSFIFSPSLGSLFDRNVNRIVGVGLGLTLGNLPEVLLFMRECHSQDCFLHYPQGPIMYLQFMFLQWALAVYGYLATGSKYSYACLLWAGFGGTQMLKSLKRKVLMGQESQGQAGGLHLDPQNADAQLFEETMDNMLGCFIVFLVDIFAANLMFSRTTELVATSVSHALEGLGVLLNKLHIGDFVGAANDLLGLKRAIEASRNRDLETQKEDHVWTTARLMPYKADLVHAVLDRLDDAQVASWTLLSAIPRAGSSAPAVVKEALPASLEGSCKLYAEVLVKALMERRGRHKKGQLVSEPPPPDLDVMFEVEQGSEEATAVVQASALALRLALRRLQALLQEHTFWAAMDWRRSEESALNLHAGLERSSSEASLDSVSTASSRTSSGVQSVQSCVRV